MSAHGAIHVPPHFIPALARPFEPEPALKTPPRKTKAVEWPVRHSDDEPEPEPSAPVLYPK